MQIKFYLGQDPLLIFDQVSKTLIKNFIRRNFHLIFLIFQLNLVIETNFILVLVNSNLSFFKIDLF